MLLIAGLGNPGPTYAKNRHNIGFEVVDELARAHALPPWKGGKLGGELTAGVLTTPRGRERAVLCKPMEFMNLSGFAVQRAAKFHAVEPDRILVVHDEIDLALGDVRVKTGGGHGGHNGLRSIIEQLGTNQFARVRLGVGRDPHVPPGGGSANAVASWVLGDFPAAQAAQVADLVRAGVDAVLTVLAVGVTAAMNQRNARPKASSRGPAT